MQIIIMSLLTGKNYINFVLGDVKSQLKMKNILLKRQLIDSYHTYFYSFTLKYTIIQFPFVCSEVTQKKQCRWKGAFLSLDAVCRY